MFGIGSVDGGVGVVAVFTVVAVGRAPVTEDCVGATTHAAAVEASPREKHSDATGDSSATMQGHDGPSSIWSSADPDPDAKPSFFQRWLASIYIKLISLKSEIQLMLSYAWKLGHTKPDNTCS